MKFVYLGEDGVWLKFRTDGMTIEICKDDLGYKDLEVLIREEYMAEKMLKKQMDKVAIGKDLEVGINAD